MSEYFLGYSQQGIAFGKLSGCYPNWVDLQHQFESIYVVDLHAITVPQTLPICIRLQLRLQPAY